MTSLGYDEFNKSTLVQVIGCSLINTMLLPEPMLTKISLLPYTGHYELNDQAT